MSWAQPQDGEERRERERERASAKEGERERLGGGERVMVRLDARAHMATDYVPPHRGVGNGGEHMIGPDAHEVPLRYRVQGTGSSRRPPDGPAGAHHGKGRAGAGAGRAVRAPTGVGLGVGLVAGLTLGWAQGWLGARSRRGHGHRILDAGPGGGAEAGADALEGPGAESTPSGTPAEELDGPPLPKTPVGVVKLKAWSCPACQEVRFEHTGAREPPRCPGGCKEENPQNPEEPRPMVELTVAPIA